MTHNKTNDDIIIWNPKNEKGIKINCSPLNSVNCQYPDYMIVRMKYYLTQQNSATQGRLIGTCLPDVIQWWNQDLHQFKKTYHKLAYWIHNDYFLVGPSNNPLIPDSNSKYELYYWPTVDEYPRIALNIPASKKSNGNITLYLDPKNCYIDTTSYSSFLPQPNYKLWDQYSKLLMESITNNNFIAGYDDLVCGPESSLGSRRFHRQIIAIPKIR